jgi:hypothetical protein
MPEPPEAPAAEAPHTTVVDHTAVYLKARELVGIKRELEAMTAQLDDLKARKAAIDEYLMEAFANEPPLNGLKVDGYTIYLRKQLWAKCEDKAKGYDALIAAGLGDFAQKSFNSQSVSALFREWDANGEAPPAELDGVITSTDTYAIGMTRSAKRKAK